MRPDPAAKQAARNKWGGFWGPWQDDTSFNSLPEGSMAEFDVLECADCQ